MFDRSACARVRVAADAHADVAALTTLAVLLRQVLNDRLASSNALLSRASILSRDQNRREIHATPDEADASAPRARTNRTVRRSTEDDRQHAAWSGLPTETRASLTDLMTRLILGHADKKSDRLDDGGRL